LDATILRRPQGGGWHWQVAGAGRRAQFAGPGGTVIAELQRSRRWV